MTLPDATERDGATTLPRGSGDEQSPSPYAEGDVIAGKYHLMRILGEGGMGSVWLAHNQMLHVDVALKLIRADLASAHTAERLLREARATARLKHPSIVRVHDYGESERGDPFIVMEVLDGEALDLLLTRKGALPATRAVQLVLPIVSALAEAHEHGIVHRDIKPENIILMADRQGTVMPKVLDFGIAKVERGKVISGEIPNDPAGLGAHELQRRLTNMGTLVGSPDYMSPEQGRGDMSVDERADIWAVCVVLYELVAGRRPFDGAEVKDVLLNLMIEDPIPLTDHGVGDLTLWQIVSKGLEKNRDERWQTARELGEALAQWLLDAGVETDVTGTALRTQWFGDDPSTDRASIASLHLDPLTVSTSHGVRVALPESSDGNETMRRALYGVVGATMLALGMAIALVVIEPTSGKEVAPPATSTTPVAIGDEEATTPQAATTTEPEASAGPVAAAESEAGPEAEGTEAGGTEADGKAPAPSPVKPLPRPMGPPLKPKPIAKPGANGLPLPPETPNF